MSDSGGVIEVERVLDRLPLTGPPLVVAIVMAVVLIVDGFDILILAYVAPAVSAEFHLATGGLGAVMTASLLGVAAGGLAGGWLGDRFGRRSIVIASLLLFGVLTFVSALARDPVTFSAARLLAGLGLGAATPNAAALMAEVLPRAWRSQIIMIAYASSTIGTTFAGLLARQVVPAWGWRGVFLTGAVLPMVAVVLVALLTSESPKFLAARRGPARTAAALNRLLGRRDFRGDETFAATRGEPKAARLGDLFAPAYRADTITLAALIFATLFAWASVGNWGTTLITSLQHPLPDAVAIMMAFNLAGLAGALATALLLRRIGSRVILAALGGASTVAAIAIGGLLAARAVPLAWITAYMLLAGACLTALLQANYPVATHLFPTDFRALGVGTCFGIGRLGAVTSSAVVALLLSRGGPPLYFAGVAAASAVAFLCVLRLRRHIPPFRAGVALD